MNYFRNYFCKLILLFLPFLWINWFLLPHSHPRQSVASVDSNINAAARLAKTLADTLVAAAGLSCEVNMVGFWLLL